MSALLVMAVIWAGVHKYGVMGILQTESRGRHCANVRGKWHFKPAQHRSGVSVWTTIENSRAKRILPSAYYPLVEASRKGMANAA